jgi:phosphatidylserine/phosphatidylglycerophosphate/cardiolipin synthase-like enzyme
MKNSQKSSHHSMQLLIILLLFLPSCTSLASSPPTLVPGSPTSVQLTSTPASAVFTGWLEIYFTDPTAPHAADYEGGPDELLVAAIDQARLTIDMAAHSFNLWSIRDALINAHKRGVVVRLVMESDNMDTREVQQIQDAGIPVVGDQREGLMHHKFVVIDRSEVWTCSMNFTASGVYRDNNNLIRIRSTQVAEDFTTEFTEMYVENLFGPEKGFSNPNPGLTIDGTPLEIYFSPEDGVAAHILALLQQANDSIFFMAYSFTSNDLGAAIIQRAANGLTVAGVMDDGQINSNQGTEYDPFMQAGLDVRRGGGPGLMHHKVIIIDRKIVISGSYNFSASAETSNDENIVIIHNADVATLYLDEFQRLYDQAQP